MKNEQTEQANTSKDDEVRMSVPVVMPAKPTFEQALRALINRYSMENGSGTPDYMLAAFLMGCLDSFNEAVNRRDVWCGFGEDTEDLEELAGGQPNAS
jgi:hypothetical protein